VAEVLGGEPKTEMWYVVDALLDSDLYAGVVPGVTRESFEEALQEGRVAEQIHKVPVKKGDAIFIPSGRVHAIGAGNLIVEVQQNSDTTYRVFDWNRIGSDGKRRALHVNESLESINFDDVEPTFSTETSGELLVECEHFRVERWHLSASRNIESGDRFAIFTVVEGSVECAGHEYTPGSFFLVPPVLAYHDLKPLSEGSVVLRTTIPS
jgi:mannose-6-phosphate isomerase